jgi:hypothetical protein
MFQSIKKNKDVDKKRSREDLGPWTASTSIACAGSPRYRPDPGGSDRATELLCLERGGFINSSDLRRSWTYHHDTNA